MSAFIIDAFEFCKSDGFREGSTPLVEMTRFLAQQGLLDAARMPPTAAGTGRPWRIPQGVRELIGARLGRLSPTCNRVLAAAWPRR